jgi:hypothetical protein
LHSSGRQHNAEESDRYALRRAYLSIRNWYTEERKLPIKKEQAREIVDFQPWQYLQVLPFLYYGLGARRTFFTNMCSLCICIPSSICRSCQTTSLARDGPSLHKHRVQEEAQRTKAKESRDGRWITHARQPPTRHRLGVKGEKMHCLNLDHHILPYFANVFVFLCYLLQDKQIGLTASLCKIFFLIIKGVFP